MIYDTMTHTVLSDMVERQIVANTRNTLDNLFFSEITSNRPPMEPMTMKTLDDLQKNI